MRTRHLNGLLIVAVLAISTAPLFAQGAQPDAAKLKADARNVVGIIGSDKAKTQAYCQIAIVGEQMRPARVWKDKKKFDELARKLPVLEKNLGPEYLALVESLGKANLRWPGDRVDVQYARRLLSALAPIANKHRRRNASRAGRMTGSLAMFAAIRSG